MIDYSQYDILEDAHREADEKLSAAQTLIDQLNKQYIDLQSQLDQSKLNASVSEAKIAQLSSDVVRLSDALSDSSDRYDQLNSLYNTAIILQTLLSEKLNAANVEIARLKSLLPSVPPPQVGFKIHSMSEQPATTWKRDIYVDPVNGLNTNDGSQAKPFKTLSYSEASSKKILPGDHIHMLAGDHANVNFYGPYGSKNLQDSQEWVWLDFKQGATVAGIQLRQVKRFLITNPILKGSGINITGTEHVVIDGAQMVGINKDPQDITVDEWMKAPGFIGTRSAKYVAITNCKAKNVRDGISVGWDQVAAIAPNNSAYALVEGNEVIGASADFSRIIASDVIYRKNKFLGGYASGGQGDGNHDDGMQGFCYPAPSFLKDAAGVKLVPVQIDPAVPYAIYSDVLVEDNFFCDRVSLTQANWSGYQGFNVFDGVYKNMTFRRNVIIGGAYHGLSLYGVQGALIENNIVLSSALAGAKTFDQYWIFTPASKGGLASTNVVVKNNIANKFSGGYPNPVENNNVVLKGKDYAATFEKFDFATGEFDFHIKPTSPLANKGLGIY
jgi:hypothetical protein